MVARRKVVTDAAQSRIEWGVIHDTWRALERPLNAEDLLRVKVTAGADTAYAIAIAQDVLTMVINWLSLAYPNGRLPPVTVPTAMVACLEKYGKSAYRRNEELAKWQVPWSTYLSAQSDVPWGRRSCPPLWTMFNDVGLNRYNRFLESAELVDGQLVPVLSAGAVRAMTTESERWRELVSRWVRSRAIITDTLLTCPGLSQSSAILLECHLLDAAYLIADRDGISAIDSGILPQQKVEAAMNLLVELERNSYTANRFYEAVIGKGAVLK